MRQFLISLSSKRSVRWSVAVFCLYAALGFFLAPWLLEKNAKQIMAENYRSDLRIANTKVNPFTLSLLISGLELDDPEGVSLVKFDEFFANFQLSSIFRKAWTFAEVRLVTPQLVAIRESETDNGFNFSYLLAQEAEPEVEDNIAGEIVPILIYDLSIMDAEIHLTDNVPDESVTTKLEQINVNVNGLTTLPDRVAQQTVTLMLENNGMLNESGGLQLNPLLATGQLNLIGVDYFPLASQYIRSDSGLDILQGLIDIDLNYSVAAMPANESDDLSIVVDSFNLTLSDLVVNTYAEATTDPQDIDLELLNLPLLQVNGGSLHWPEQTLTLASINFDNSHINIFRDAESVFSLAKLPMLNSREEVQDNQLTDATTSGQPWYISLDTFQINQLSLNLTDETVGTSGELGISDLSLNIGGLNNELGTRFPTVLSVALMSGGNVNIEGEFLVLPTPEFDFDLEVVSVALNALQPYIGAMVDLNIESGMMNVSGGIAQSAEELFDFSGKFDIVDLSLLESEENERLASWKELSADNISLSLTNSNLEISEVKFFQPYGDVIIGSDGSLNLGRIQVGSNSESDSDSAQENTQIETTNASDNQELTDPWAITIGRVSIEEGSADFSDFSLPLPFSAAIAELNGQLSTISTISTESSVVDFEGKVDEFGLLRISGSFLPFDPKTNTDINLSFQNIVIPKFSAYAIPFVGREISDGRLDVDLGFKLVDSQLAGDNLIVLRDLQLGERVEYPDAVNLPLDLAVALLKGPDGNIDLDLPVSGDIDDPQFSYGNVVIEIFRNLITNIVTAPFSFLANLVGFEGEELEYIDFLSGRADLTPPQLEKAGKLAEALLLRSELVLEISGVIDRDLDGLALRSNKVDVLLEAMMEQEGQSQTEEDMYAQQRRAALEELYFEALASDVTLPSVENLQVQFSRPIERETVNSNELNNESNSAIDNGLEAAMQLDELAYANEIYRLLVNQQIIQEAEFEALAVARANNTQNAVLASDESLLNRVLLVPIQELSSDDTDLIRMKVSISAN